MHREKRNAYRFLVRKSLKGYDHLGDLGVTGKINK
jgi:hypothetical protein